LRLQSETLADALQIVLPHLPPSLVAAEIVPRIQNLACRLPPITPAGFEIRLRADEPQVDLLQCITAGEDAPLILADYIRSSEWEAQPAWARLADFCCVWDDGASPLHGALRDIWLEFDLDAKAIHATPIPSVFLTLNTKLPATDTFAAMEAALPLLLASPGSPVLLDNITRCFRAVPEGGVISHIGLMLSRSVEALRVNVQQLGREQVEPFLTQLGWSAALTGLDELLGRIFELVDHATLCLDMGVRLYPRLGLECTTRQLTRRPAQLMELLDDLVKRNLCAPEKRAALAQWTGATSPKTTGVGWPDHLIARSLMQPPDRFSVMGRRLSHIKLTFQPGRALEAKGYIGFGNLWVKPGTAEPEPIAALQTLHGTDGLPRADRVRVFHFPADHGPHCEYQTEWWYYTGNVATAERRRFGYQLTFFRRILAPSGDGAGQRMARPQLYFAHFAITDVEGNRHLKSERTSRAAGGAAGTPFRVWIEDWSVEALNADGAQVRLRAAYPSGMKNDKGDAFGLDLTLAALKPLVLQGEAGLSQKTDAVGNASYYISFSRLWTEGTLYLNGDSCAVQGLSWMDHEWGTTELGPRAVGWDWFSIQLDDERDVMFYHIRNKDGSVEPLSSGAVIEPDGTVMRLRLDQVKLNILETWKSTQSRRTYPARWNLQIPSAELDLTLTPLVADQEMPQARAYWEGAVQIEGTSKGAQVKGSGYVELTGYGAKVGEGNYERNWR